MDISSFLFSHLLSYSGDSLTMKLIKRVNSQRRHNSKQSEFDQCCCYRAKTPTEASNSMEKLNTATIKPPIPHKKLIVYISITIVMLTSILVAIAVILNATSNNDPINDIDDDIIFNPNDTDQTLGKHHIFTRKEWGGRKPLNFTRPLQHPTEYVLISHTAGNSCDNLVECSAIMRQIQSYHVATLKSPDIGYNFLIGGDGNIYVGRGWDIRNFHRDHNIGISFMGNYVFDKLTPQMVSALKELLKQGVEMEKLRWDYKIVCHNQTSATLSPGVHVYEVISQLPHFYPRFVIIN